MMEQIFTFQVVFKSTVHINVQMVDDERVEDERGETSHPSSNIHSYQFLV